MTFSGVEGLRLVEESGTVVSRFVFIDPGTRKYTVIHDWATLRSDLRSRAVPRLDRCQACLLGATVVWRAGGLRECVSTVPRLGTQESLAKASVW
jgi:hypothetical protein